MKEAAQALLDAIEREFSDQTPKDQEWLRRLQGNLRKITEN